MYWVAVFYTDMFIITKRNNAKTLNFIGKQYLFKSRTKSFNKMKKPLLLILLLFLFKQYNLVRCVTEIIYPVGE